MYRAGDGTDGVGCTLGIFTWREEYLVLLVETLVALHYTKEDCGRS